MSKLVETLAARGRHGDTMLAHITPEEGQLLQSLGGSGTTNPETGLPEYFLPVALGIASAAGSLMGGIGSLLGGNKQAKAAKKQLELQRDQFAFDRDMSNRMMDAQLGKQTDPYGNTIEYDPVAKEWRSVFAPDVKRLADASLLEETMRARYDMPLQRSQRDTNADRRSDESSAADTYLRQLMSPSPYSAQGITNNLKASALSGIDDAYRGTTETASRQALRSGSGGAQLIGQIGRDRSRETSQALRDAEIQGLEAFEGLERSRTARLADPYNMLAGRASNIADIPFAPESMGTELATALKTRSAQAPYGMAMAGNLASKNIAGLNAALGAQGRTSPLPGQLEAIGTMLGTTLPDIVKTLGPMFSNRQVGNEGLLDPNTAENPLNWGA